MVGMTCLDRVQHRKILTSPEMIL